jgi:hypothetical protein
VVQSADPDRRRKGDGEGGRAELVGLN